MDLRTLFTEPIRTQRAFADVHPGQASDVWLVQTDAEEVVVRTTRLAAEPDNDFWWGCRALFGVDPTDVFALESLNAALHAVSIIPVPQVLRKAELDGKPFVVVEKMAGAVVHRFSDLPVTALERLGQSLAGIHTRRFREFGTPGGRLRYPAAEFNRRMVETMRGLVERFHRDDAELVHALEPICEEAESLPHPQAGALIMMDMDPTQYLSDGTRITALVDTEVYVIGPRELEFVALEYLLDAPRARAFLDGYARVLPPPCIRQVRRVYRYLNRLLSVQGSVDYARWMNWPTVF